MPEIEWTETTSVYTAEVAGVSYTVHRVSHSTWRWIEEGAETRWHEHGDYHSKDEAMEAVERSRR